MVQPNEEEKVMSNKLQGKSSSEIRKGTAKSEVSKCPRCNSSNTKFCYYNNYSLNQPRFFCKTCRRYWTQGGTLRNVPVGGSKNKNKRLPSSSSDLHQIILNPNPSPTTAAAALNFGFPLLSTGYKSFSDLISMPDFEDKISTTATGSSRSAADRFCLPTSSSSFLLDGYGTNSSSTSLQETSSNGRRLLFPFEDLNKVYTTTNFDDQNGSDAAAGVYWNGPLGGESW